MIFTRTCALALGIIISAAGTVFTASSAQAADTPSCADFTVKALQVAKPSNNASLVTKWQDEANIAEDLYGFSQDLGVLAKVAGSNAAGLVPVYRLYKGGDFVWAAKGGDVDDLVAAGYQRQFVDFYASADDSSCLAPVYRLKKGAIHRMASASDTADLISSGWTQEEVAFYANTGEQETPPTQPQPDPDPEPEPQPPADGTDTKFTFAVLPDTQNEVVSANDSRFKNRAQWLADNKSSLDLRYAFQVGDLVNWGNVAPNQLTKASNDIKPLEAAVPWVPVVGNHDTAAVCAGGSACPGANANVTVRDTSKFNAAFPVSRFPNVKGTFEANKIDNSYQLFSAGGVQWMALSLELWPRPAVVAWAKSVVAAHPDANVIVATHSYLEADGSISGSNGGYGATSPQYLYDNLIKVYPNIKMVLSGHVGNSAVRTDTGVNGNKILSLLQCYHSSTNPVRLLEVDTAAGTATSRVYAPLSKTDYPSDSTSTNGLSFIR